MADGKTRELIVTLDPQLLTPEIVHAELEQHEQHVLQKSGLDRSQFRQLHDLLFEHIETVPVREFHDSIERAKRAIGEVDADDVLYLACALGCEASIWSDDADFRDQDLARAYTTTEVVQSFETG